MKGGQGRQGRTQGGRMKGGQGRTQRGGGLFGWFADYFNGTTPIFPSPPHGSTPFVQSAMERTMSLKPADIDTQYGRLS